MKKYFLIVAVSSTFMMCKKGESTSSQLENAVSSADSTVADISEKADAVNNTAEAVFDSASIKIKDFEKTKSGVIEKMESTSKSIDSLSDKITNMKLESKIDKKDSLKKNSEKIVVNVPAPKIIKETKVIYKEKPRNDNYETIIPKNRMTKTGLLELIVDDAETAKEIVKDEVKKYDGIIKSENISLNNNDKKIAYLRVKVPIQKFDYLMEDLSQNIGKVENKGIDVSGENFINNTFCDVEITLYGSEENAAVNNQPEGFGSQSLAAVSSGWNVITSIFLFILPLWPLFLIAGIGYYFYKKKNNKLPGNDK